MTDEKHVGIKKKEKKTKNNFRLRNRNGIRMTDRFRSWTPLTRFRTAPMLFSIRGLTSTSPSPRATIILPRDARPTRYAWMEVVATSQMNRPFSSSPPVLSFPLFVSSFLPRSVDLKFFLFLNCNLLGFLGFRKIKFLI